MNFSKALEALKTGERLHRKGWNGKDMYLYSQVPDDGSMMTHPYLCIVIPECTEGLRKLPWQPAQVDLFADDWSVI